MLTGNGFAPAAPGGTGKAPGPCLPGAASVSKREFMQARYDPEGAIQRPSGVSRAPVHAVRPTGLAPAHSCSAVDRTNGARGTGMRIFLASFTGLFLAGAVQAQTPSVRIEFGGDQARIDTTDRDYRYKEGEAIDFILIRSTEDFDAFHSDLNVDVRVSESGNMLRAGRNQTIVATFRAGEDLTWFSVPTTDDINRESDSRIIASISSGAGYRRGSPGSVTRTWVDDDYSNSGTPGAADDVIGVGTVEVTAVASSYRAGSTAQFRISRSGSTSGQVRVPIRVFASPHLEPWLPALPTEATIRSGSRSTTVSLPINRAADLERESTIELVVLPSESPLRRYDLGTETAMVSVAATPETITWGQYLADDIREGDTAYFSVHRRTAKATPLEVRVSFNHSGARNYIAPGTVFPRTITIPAKQRVGFVEIPTIEYASAAIDGVLRATLASGSGYQLGSSSTRTRTVTIQNRHDAAPDLRLQRLSSSIWAGRMSIGRRYAAVDMGSCMDPRIITSLAELGLAICGPSRT